MRGLRQISCFLVFSCSNFFLMSTVYADEASSQPVAIQQGQPAPFSGLILSFDLGKKMMKDSETNSLLEQKLQIDEQMFTVYQTQIKTLQDDKTQLNALNVDQNKLFNSANKYNGLIYGGFFIAGVLSTVLIALALKVTVK